MNYIKTLLKKKPVLITIIVVIVLGGYFGFRALTTKSATIQYVTSPVERGTLSVSVSGTGQIAAENSVDIKPMGNGGTVASVNNKVGDTVKTGQIIATLDQSSISSQISQAKASVAQAQANYDKLIAGLNSTDAAAAKAQLDSAQNSLDNAKTSYNTVVSQQTQAVNNARFSYLNAGLAAVPSDTLSTATVSISGSYTGTTEGNYVITTYSAGDGLHYSISGLGNTNGILTRGLQQPIGNGLYVTFSSTGTLYSNTSWTIAVPNTLATNYYSNYNAYQSALQNQTIALNSAQNQIDSAQNSLIQAQATYDAKIAPPTTTDVAVAKAQIESAQAQLQSAQATFQNNLIVAPFDGVLAAVNINKSDQVGSNTVVATLITKQQVAEISLNEVDAAKVKVGQKAVLTFDAFPDLSLTGQVAQIDIIGTVTQGVVNYKVKISLDTQDDRIKPAMSVSVSVIIDVAEDVLIVPNSAVKTQGSSSYVQVLVNNKPQQVTVTTGLSNDTSTEVSGNIKEGDKVVTQTINPNAKITTTSTTQSSGLRLPGLGGGGGAGGLGR